MSKRVRQRGAKRRGGGGQASRSARAQARARADLIYDLKASPELAAEVLFEAFGGDPADPLVIPSIVARTDAERARAIVSAALERTADPTALSLAADLAILEGHADQAEEHVVHALQIVDSPELRLRQAAALAAQGRLAAAVDVLDGTLREEPLLTPLMMLRGSLLADLVALEGRPAQDCACGSGKSHEDCCGDEGRRVLDRFRDRTPLLRLHSAVARFTRSRPELVQAVSEGIEAWVASDAVSREELDSWTDIAASDAGRPEARTLQLIHEWAWAMPLVGEEDDILSAYADHPDAEPDLAQLGRDVAEVAMWGFWEIADPAAAPGVVVTELLTGGQLHAEIPAPLLAGLSRWSVLFGYFAPVDGVWRSGSGFVVASPVEARDVAHQFLDTVHDLADRLGREGRPLVRWANRIHDDFSSLWLAEAADIDPDTIPAYMALTRAVAPSIVAWTRAAQRGADGEEGIGFTSARLAVANGRAAWRALKGHPDFVEGRRGLYWGTRGVLSAQRNGIAAYLKSSDDLPELLDLLADLGHPARLVDQEVLGPEDFEDDQPPPPVTLPEDPDEVAAALRSWPDQPLEALNGLTPRQALQREQAEAEVEMLIRHLEYDADTRQLESVDTNGLRSELGLPTADDQIA